ncbi:TPA: hypothetical protein N0F65_001812 [Lagenidium giganteum]|uniref:Uncharacterized protein n=1 Tax=Lagenidium giganteum TaxID=4803 RepID=A0AAV2Z6K2_9STRA|nr:TPA: hypothetical protein N0F65_001812 [Lagenidium giganteum]
MVVAAAAATSDSAVVLENQENVDHGNRLAASGDPNASDISLTQEKLEDLILEAYTSMQSDGESIFLPEEVASKLHTMAELVRGCVKN